MGKKKGEKKGDLGRKKIFIICPVRGASKMDKDTLETYVSCLEAMGCDVHYPPRDTYQKDPVGLRICSENREGIKWADEVHVYWTEGSEGSRFDLGMAFISGKPIYLINRNGVKKTPHKSIQNVLLGIDEFYSLSCL